MPKKEIFKENKNITKDPASHKFFERLENARKEEERKKQRVLRDLSKIVGDKWQKPIAKKSDKHRSNSTEEPYSTIKQQKITTIKKTLHNELHSFYLPNFEEEEQQS
jgi:hypothetical protein